MRVLDSKEDRGLVELDKRDTDLLDLLASNSRLTKKHIASKLKISPKSVDYRIKRLEDVEVITGSRTVINTKKLGLQSYHFFLHTPKLNEVVKKAKNHPQVNALIAYSGQYNLELSILAKTPTQAQEALSFVLESSKSRDINPLTMLQTIKAQVLPGHKEYKSGMDKVDSSFQKVFYQKKEEHTPDHADLNLLLSLANNANQTLTTLSRKLNLNKDTLRNRIHKLIQSDIILQFRPVINFQKIGYSIQTLLLKTNFDQASHQEFKHLINAEKNILWCAKSMGSYDYVVYYIDRDVASMHDFLHQIEETIPNFIQTTDILFAFKEFKYSFMTGDLSPLLKQLFLNKM